MANKKKQKKLTLSSVFLKENEMSLRYGLDSQTPKNVYVPDTTQNRVITHTEEEPIEECGCGEPQGPHIHRVGAPGGPDLGGGNSMMNPSLDPTAMPHNEPGNAIVLFDVDQDPLQNEGGLRGLEGESEWEDDQEAEEDNDFDIRNYDDEPSSDKHSSDWKPRPRNESKELNKRRESEDMQFEGALKDLMRHTKGKGR